MPPVERPELMDTDCFIVTVAEMKREYTVIYCLSGTGINIPGLCQIISVAWRTRTTRDGNNQFDNQQNKPNIVFESFR